jgi:hypothetical protein
MKNEIANALSSVDPGIRAELKTGRIPGKHMAALLLRGTELKSGDRKRPKAQAKTTTTASPAAKAPTLTHAARVKQAEHDSIRAELEREEREKQERELEYARNAGKRMRERKAHDEEMAKRKEAFAPIAAAMDAAAKGTARDRALDAAADASEAAARGVPVKAKAKTQAVKVDPIIEHYESLAPSERKAFYKSHRAAILRAMDARDSHKNK